MLKFLSLIFAEVEKILVSLLYILPLVCVFRTMAVILSSWPCNKKAERGKLFVSEFAESCLLRAHSRFVSFVKLSPDVIVVGFVSQVFMF